HHATMIAVPVKALARTAGLGLATLRKMRARLLTKDANQTKFQTATDIGRGPGARSEGAVGGGAGAWLGGEEEDTGSIDYRGRGRGAITGLGSTHPRRERSVV